MGACNGEAWRNFRDPAPLESWGQSLDLSGGGAPELPAKPRPPPLGAAEGARAPTVAMETARASSGNPWQPHDCQEDELWRTRQPLRPFLGKGEPRTGVSARRPGILKVRGP